MLALYCNDTYWYKDGYVYKNLCKMFDCVEKPKIFCCNDYLFVLHDNALFLQNFGTLNFEEFGKITDISCGPNYAFLLNQNGELWCCGDNNLSQLGLKIYENKLTKINYNFGNIKKIETSNATTFILTHEGKIFVTGVFFDYDHAFNHTNKINFWKNNKVKNKLYSFVDFTYDYDAEHLKFILDIICGTKFYFVTCLNKICFFGNSPYIDEKNCLDFIDINVNNIKKILCSRETAFFLMHDNSLFGVGYNGKGQLAQNDYLDRNCVTQIFFNCGEIKNIYCHKFGDTLIVENTIGEFYGCGDNTNDSLCVMENNKNIQKYCSFQKLLYDNKHINLSYINSIAI
jgi:alpha-tubulin suppressor-like RCC1 family protein